MWDHGAVVAAVAEAGRVLMRFDRFARTSVNAPGTTFPNGAAA